MMTNRRCLLTCVIIFDDMKSGNGHNKLTSVDPRAYAT